MRPDGTEEVAEAMRSEFAGWDVGCTHDGLWRAFPLRQPWRLLAAETAEDLAELIRADTPY